jgi:hypothetical protein
MLKRPNTNNLYNKVNNSLNFTSLILPENEKDYNYLSKFFKIGAISDEEKIKTLLDKEK